MWEPILVRLAFESAAMLDVRRVAASGMLNPNAYIKVMTLAFGGPSCGPVRNDQVTSILSVMIPGCGLHSSSFYSCDRDLTHD
jgi:hypothetical protein